jgi:DNA-binding protein H-NS
LSPPRTCHLRILSELMNHSQQLAASPLFQQPAREADMMDAADLEAAICDLAKVTSMLMELSETEQAGVGKREITASTAAEHVKNWQSSSSFAVYHLRSTGSRSAQGLLRKLDLTSETARQFTPGAVTKPPGIFYCGKRRWCAPVLPYGGTKFAANSSLHWLDTIAQQPADGKMKTNILESMSVNELLSLHEQVNSLLASKMSAEKARLEAKLRRLNGAVIAPETARRPYPPVHPKFRNPVEPSQTWAGRGKQPRWLSAFLRKGKKMDDFRIAS